MGFCFSKTPYDSICQNFKTMFLGSNSLENVFKLRYYQHSDLPQKVTQPSFVLGAIGSFSFPTPMSIYIWSISLSTPDNIEMSLTTWISLMPISVNWLYRCFTYLGGSFIELTTHAFFILNIAKFKFEKMSKLTKLDWIFFFRWILH